MQELVEQQVAATTQLTGQVGRLEGQMEAVRRQLDMHDTTTRKLQETLDRLLSQVTAIEAEKRSAAVAIKVAWAVVIAAAGLLAWIVSSFGITIGGKK